MGDRMLIVMKEQLESLNALTINFGTGGMFIVNIILAFVMFGVDKRRSKIAGARRIPEKTLFSVALLGGAFGAAAGMFAFRHKTRHWYFRCGLPLLSIVQFFLYIWMKFDYYFW